MRTPLQRWWWWDPPRGVGLECHGQPWCWGGGGLLGSRHQWGSCWWMLQQVLAFLQNSVRKIIRSYFPFSSPPQMEAQI